MVQNVASADRVIRVVLALLISILLFTHVISGTVGIILGIVGIVFLITSFIGFCPLYKLIGISTKKKKN